MQRGFLKNGNPPGDFTQAPRCGALNRRGTTCQCPAMANGRCRLHGGLSTGPKTPEGIKRIQKANTKHGRYSKAARELRRRNRESSRESRELLRDMRLFRKLLRWRKAITKKRRVCQTAGMSVLLDRVEQELVRIFPAFAS